MKQTGGRRNCRCNKQICAIGGKKSEALEGLSILNFSRKFPDLVPHERSDFLKFALINNLLCNKVSVTFRLNVSVLLHSGTKQHRYLFKTMVQNCKHSL